MWLSRATVPGAAGVMQGRKPWQTPGGGGSEAGGRPGDAGAKQHAAGCMLSGITTTGLRLHGFLL